MGDHLSFSHTSANGSNTSLSTTHSVLPATPHPPPSNGTSTPRDPYVPLKETKFYKRVVTEDIEPTLRLDLAPGVSWLTRRTVLTSICEGGLIVEPMPASTRIYVFSCSMCGEHRKGDKYLRTHRFRTSDNDNAQRYPLCTACLEKVRTCCDFVGYLRMIKDGHIRINDADEEKDAWEECVRLREKLFWCRIGGGVIPSFVPLNDSPKLEQNKDIAESDRPSEESVRNASGNAEPEDTSETKDDPFKSDEKRVSIGKTAISNESESIESSTSTNGHTDSADSTPDDSDKQLHKNLRDSLTSNPSPHGSRPVTPSRNSERLSITIPGSFN
jgi:Rab guanine nucleotide exchange factor SEC2